MTEPAAAHADSHGANPGELQGTPQTTRRVQQRLAQRYAMPAQITAEYLGSHAKLHDGQRRFWVATRDLSTRGISFYHWAMMYYGERIRLELRAQGGELRCLEARVVRCRRRPDGRFEVGAVFEKGDKMPPAEPKFAMPDGADE